MPEDVAGWVHTFASVAETYPACIDADSTIPGNPMIFTNGEFGRVTGYAKHESQGRNCRFLQGLDGAAGCGDPGHAPPRRRLPREADQLPQERRALREPADDASGARFERRVPLLHRRSV